MFLRSSVVKKGGKTYRYWKLVKNVRTDTGPRQQVVAHLGDLSNFTAADWQSLAGRMGEPEMAAALQRRVRQGGRQGPSPKWTVEDRSAPASHASDVVSIRLSETSWREPVAFGDVYAALVLWKRLGLAELLGARMNGPAAKVPWPPCCLLHVLCSSSGGRRHGRGGDAVLPRSWHAWPWTADHPLRASAIGGG